MPTWSVERQLSFAINSSCVSVTAVDGYTGTVKARISVTERFDAAKVVAAFRLSLKDEVFRAERGPNEWAVSPTFASALAALSDSEARALEALQGVWIEAQMQQVSVAFSMRTRSRKYRRSLARLPAEGRDALKNWRDEIRSQHLGQTRPVSMAGRLTIYLAKQGLSRARVGALVTALGIDDARTKSNDFTRPDKLATPEDLTLRVRARLDRHRKRVDMRSKSTQPPSEASIPKSGRDDGRSFLQEQGDEIGFARCNNCSEDQFEAADTAGENAVTNDR